LKESAFSVEMAQMKRFLLLALAVPLLFTSCMTSQVLAKAQGKNWPVQSDEEAAPPPAPLYYALLPISIPVDIAFYPFFFFRDQALAREQARCD
jgi:hypothetical protein